MNGVISILWLPTFLSVMNGEPYLYSSSVEISVVDRVSLNPDPAFQNEFGSRVLITKSCQKSWKNLSFVDQKLHLLIHKGRPSYRRNLQPSTENIEHLKKWNILTFFFYLCGSFLPSWIRIWIRIANQDPDPGTLLNPDPTTLVEMIM